MPKQLSFDGQAPPLVVVEKDLLSPEFLFEDLVFCDQVLDHMLLLAINPAGQTEQEYMPWLNDEAHTFPPEVLEEK